MASVPESSLEEILWRSPPHVQMMGGRLHSNNILFYFAESPFFDPTSNNASLAIQANYNEAFRQFIETREAFEGRLATMQGLEFVVSYDPLQAAAQPDGSFATEPSNIWVIRKQTRRKRVGQEDEVEVLSTYFVVGDCIYMAPSVASVIGNRILSAVTSLSSLLKTASTLPTFTPAHGHTYLPPTSKPTDTAAQPPGAPAQQSKENTPMPDAPMRAPLVGSQVAQTGGSVSQDTRTLAESFSLLSRYGDEFMDENPLVGEPGSFIMSKTGDTAAGMSKQGPNAAASATSGRVTTPQVRVDTPGSGLEKGAATPSIGLEEGKLRKKGKVGS
ncbi:mediator complex subunit MED6 [Aspergillus saccharolyticus JOP 1030-1]|uniref:Mediator of RNA polymerase II transcription subunit 6 n=1 Tax=Aspergillus saccharolyticus JOP 1030-1 TaxID=1450539 RepID=A0A319AP63_9EURO|nr:RNA polymerase II transcription mediator complex subunit Med6 [Aspergillus saccharolyticus JOP 1030-1]PYH48262.1 RNA polymerase II transcription mediator complex subunit Med6 [Aspergillus saccharolyticus JOP 1030-1]